MICSLSAVDKIFGFERMTVNLGITIFIFMFALSKFLNQILKGILLEKLKIQIPIKLTVENVPICAFVCATSVSAYHRCA